MSCGSALRSFGERDLHEVNGHIVELRSKIVVVTGELCPERRQVHSAFDIIHRVRAGKAYLANPRPHLLYRAFQQVPYLIEIRFVMQDRAVSGNNRVRIQARRLL